MMARFQPGEMLDLVIRGARVIRSDDRWTEVCYPAPGHSSDVVLTVAPASTVTMTRVAPAEWPPQPGDVWEDAKGVAWFARNYDGEAYFTSTETNSEDACYVLDQHGPMTLVYRKGWSPTPAADIEAEPVEVDKRAAKLAGLRALVEFIEAHPSLPVHDVSVEAKLLIDARNDEQGFAELRRIADLLGVEANTDDSPGARHPRADRWFADGVLFDVVYVTSRSMKEHYAANAAKRAAAVVAPPAGDAVAVTVAEAAGAPEGAERATCSYCGGPIWKGLIWVHEQGEDARCPGDETFYATPECGAVFPGKPGQEPCRKSRGHEDGLETDWKRDLHSNGLLKWPVDPPAVEPSPDVPDQPEPCDECETTGRNCIAHRRPAANPIPADEAV